ncbi:Fe-Mn family superoxide dismutase [Candidatus Erwinia haradaeae]|uniref:Superoxide dismutase n=1 Tax=Candidatus Erwinia haradaeae TaxID=1922217 RepID=A0A451D1Q9_9GAMM|nr:Fe-Mn family superoxide dismutase [Candidatus Erwinia haradaeae]VFP79559.1 Superoxide dismutase [Mn] [Candidatus Erwinia haradaeae]
MSYILPSLPYAYDALEPYFDKETMIFHHTKHHKAYIDKVNVALEGTDLLNIPVETLISQINKFPENKKNLLRNNAGGHANHSFFWKILKPHTCLNGKLKKAIEKNFGSIEDFKNTFEEVSLSCFGSGWSWLIQQNNKLVVTSTANQDNPLMGESISGTFGIPILGLDLWEHAYYLQYKNQRINYIRSFWNLVNWDQVTINFLETS